MIRAKTPFPLVKAGLPVPLDRDSLEDLKDLEILIAAKKANDQAPGIPLSEAKKELLKRED